MEYIFHKDFLPLLKCMSPISSQYPKQIKIQQSLKSFSDLNTKLVPIAFKLQNNPKQNYLILQIN